MNVRPCFLFPLALLLSLPVASATTEPPLTGSYSLTGATLVDAPADEARDTHLRLHLAGSAARDLYGAMKVEAVRDECLDDGSVSKTIGGTQCTREATGNDYQCWLSINIGRQTIEPGSVC